MIIDFWRPRRKGEKIVFYEKLKDWSYVKSESIIRFKCDQCRLIKGIKYCNLIKSKKVNLDEQICKQCAIENFNKKDRHYYYQSFKESAELKGYLMISEEDEYNNATTKLEMLCPFNHHIFVSKNGWFSNKGCYICNNGYKPVDGKIRCRSCEKWKPFSEYHKNKRICKECRYLHSQIEEERISQLERNKKWRNSEKGKQFEQDRKISRRISSAIRSSLNCNGTKNEFHWEELVDFTLEELLEHLENQFDEGMIWENHGDWHIDHIRPISSFNFQSPEDPEFKECWCLENLQPLWAEDNLRKKDKYLLM